MKIKPTCIIERVAMLLLLATLNHQPSTFAQGTAFTYQGRLHSDANPATGLYDLRFTIYDSTNNPGADDRSIATVDESGVALAAIQGLNQKLTEELKRRDTENAELKRELRELRRIVERLDPSANQSGL